MPTPNEPVKNTPQTAGRETQTPLNTGPTVPSPRRLRSHSRGPQKPTGLEPPQPAGTEHQLRSRSGGPQKTTGPEQTAGGPTLHRLRSHADDESNVATPKPLKSRGRVGEIGAKLAGLNLESEGLGDLTPTAKRPIKRPTRPTPKDAIESSCSFIEWAAEHKGNLSKELPRDPALSIEYFLTQNFLPGPVFKMKSDGRSTNDISTKSSAAAGGGKQNTDGATATTSEVQSEATSNKDDVSKLAKIVFVPDMIEKLIQQVENSGLMQDPVPTLNTKHSVEDCLTAAQFSVLSRTKGMYTLAYRTEHDTEDWVRSMLGVANDLYKVMQTKLWNISLLQHFASAGGSAHIPDLVLHKDDPREEVEDDHYDITVEVKTEAALPMDTPADAGIVDNTFKCPPNPLAICFKWPEPVPKKAKSQVGSETKKDGQTKDKDKTRAQTRDKMTKILTQVWAQMDDRGARFSILTTYAATWFLYRRDDTLAISRSYNATRMTPMDLISFFAAADETCPDVTMDTIDVILANADVSWWNDSLIEISNSNKAGVQPCTDIRAMKAFLGKKNRMQ